MVILITGQQTNGTNYDIMIDNGLYTNYITYFVLTGGSNLG